MVETLSLQWNNVPIPIMSTVYSHLSLNDKLTSSITCKRWREALVSPRHLKLKSKKLYLICSDFKFKKMDQSLRDEVELFKQFGRFYKSVFVFWCQCFAKTITNLFLSTDWQHFRAGTVCLGTEGNLPCSKGYVQKFTSNRSRSTNTIHTPKLLEIVSMLKNLQSISLGYSCDANFVQEFHRQNFTYSTKMKNINLAFITNEKHQKPDIPTDYKWAAQVETLTINYEFVSVELLNKLSSFRNIQTLTILLQGTSPRKYVPFTQWEKLKSTMPLLKVNLIIVEDESFNEVIRNLSPTMDIHTLTLVYEVPYFFQHVFGYMNSLYKDCLEKALVYYIEKDKDSSFQQWMYAFDERCPKVEQIELYGLNLFTEDILSLALSKSWTNEKLELIVPKENIYIDSLCSVHYCLKVSARQLKALEAEMSEILQCPWRASRECFKWNRRPKDSSFQTMAVDILQNL